MREEEITDLINQVKSIDLAIKSLEGKAVSLHYSAKRAGMQLGHSKAISKLQLASKVLKDALKDISKSGQEHAELLRQGRDSEANQKYNYNKFDLRRLPVKKLES